MGNDLPEAVDKHNIITPFTLTPLTMSRFKAQIFKFCYDQDISNFLQSNKSYGKNKRRFLFESQRVELKLKSMVLDCVHNVSQIEGSEKQYNIKIKKIHLGHKLQKHSIFFSGDSFHV